MKKMSLRHTIQYVSSIKNANKNSDSLLEAELQKLNLDINPYLVIIAYGLIMVVSLVGNLFVCKVAFNCKSCGRQRPTRTTTYLLIGSLSLSDLIMTIFNIPFHVTRIVLPHWPFGSFFCYAVPYIQTACVYVSTFTMTAIALHRWRAISPNAYENHLIRYNNCIMITCVWVLSAIFALPTIVFNTLKVLAVNGQIVTRCRVHYPLPHIQLVITQYVFVTQYVIPLLITCALYVKIAQIVTKQGRLMTFSNTHTEAKSIGISSDENRRRRHMEAKRRRIIMLALVVVVFAICWLPLHLYFFLTDIGAVSHHTNIYLTCHWFAMSSICYNCFIYCWLNTSFKSSAKKTFEFVFSCAKHRQAKKTKSNNDNHNDEDGDAVETPIADAPNQATRMTTMSLTGPKLLAIPQQNETTLFVETITVENAIEE